MTFHIYILYLILDNEKIYTMTEDSKEASANFYGIIIVEKQLTYQSCTGVAFSVAIISANTIGACLNPGYNTRTASVAREEIVGPHIRSDDEPKDILVQLVELSSVVA